MSRLRRSVPLALFVFLAPFLQPSLAQSTTTPNTASRVQIAASEEKIVVTLTLAQKVQSATSARISTTLVSPDDIVWAASNDDVVLRPGQNKITATLTRPFHGIPPAEINDPHWLRVKYEVKSSTGEVLASGIEALRTSTTDPFVLTAAAGRIVAQGRAYEVRTHVQSSSGAPLRGVPISGELTWEGMRDTEKINTSARSDGAGNATLQFTLPNRLPIQSGELRVRARSGLVVRTVEHNVFFHAASYLLLDTDKDIYQPGQTVHARTLYFDPKRKAVANEALDVRIVDEENTLVSRQEVTTNAFGVASLDWSIPANARQGKYSLQVQVTSTEEDDDAFQARTAKEVRVYRYDLPNFRVTAKADRVYYLPAQKADVTVTAEYLFGKPVTRGKVRVVQEEERNWNYRKQRWESEESQVQAGELNRDGSFTARFDLAEKHEDLADDRYREYRDVKIAAYVTDLTTGRTEQRRLALRITRDPIHVYIAEAGPSTEKLPKSYYISAFYADGTPARCKVKLSLVNDDDHSQVKQQVATVETNKYGLAKASTLKFDLDDKHDTLLAEALDGKGLKGQATERVYDSDDDTIAVSGSRSILKGGDPIEVVVQSTKPARLVVQAVREGAVLASRHVSLGRGASTVTFPYAPWFTDEITVVAYSLEDQVDSYRYMWGSRTVLYPKNRNLEVDLKLDKDEHRPGEGAVARIAVRLPDKSPAESALGMKVVDSAVAERARTDSEFGGGSYSWRWSLWSSNDSGFSGITRDDLDRIDLSEPVPEDLELVAEYILRGTRGDQPEVLSDKSETTPDQVFSKYFARQMRPIVSALSEWNDTGKVPRNVDEVKVAAAGKGTDLGALRDPWGTPYHYEARFRRGDFIFSFLSAGPDKRFDTPDDFEARQTSERYFKYYGDAITRAGDQLEKNESRFIRDRKTLDAELKKQGIDFEELRDPWGKPYKTSFEIQHSYFVTRVLSVGETEPGGKPIETLVWEAHADYFAQLRTEISRILSVHLHNGGSYPQDEAEFRAIIKKAGIDLDPFRDPWGSAYYVVLQKGQQYGDRVSIRQRATSGGRTAEPVTLVRKEVRLISPGPDRKAGTADDFAVASYSTLVTEQGTKDEKPRPAPTGLNLLEGTGAIIGSVADPMGAVIPRASVTAVRQGSSEKYSATADVMGNFELANLPPGNYDLEAFSQGFRTTRVVGLPVSAGNATEVSFELGLGSVSETVSVEAEAVQVFTESASLVALPRNFVSLGKLPRGVVAGEKEPMSTPRLRQDFPETMLWEPALITDPHGRARLNFKLADNITTWRLSAVASTKNGELGHAERDLRAFQPFFVEHDPPRVLTQGDEIAYPVVLRNYLDRAQTLKASIKPETWFAMTGPSELPVHVEPGDASRAIFRYRASAPVAAGKQQVSAANATISDAAEKTVDVHPFGRQASDSASIVIRNSGTVTIGVPEDAMAGTLRGRVKIYPNLLAHVVENLEAGLERPHGCGEQTISSTYPSLLVAEIYAKVEDKPPVARKAQRYLVAGYERLLRYQGASGGFTYWGSNDAADASLTSYAIDFLSRASALIDVDGGVITRAEDWLLRQQSAEGTWQPHWGVSKQDALMTTAYVAQVLSQTPESDKDRQKARKTAIDKSLAYLATHRDLLDEPYAIASYALAAKAVGDEKTGMALVDWLRTNAHFESDGAYWMLERNSPFYGWGRTGRLESTAMAMRALGAFGNESDKPLRGQGLLFLLRNTDGEGMWYSGQTTVQVLKAMLDMDAPISGRAQKLQIRINEKDVREIELPGGRTVEPPIEIDVSELVRSGENQMTLAMSGDGLVSAQLVADWYVPWKDAVVASSSTNSSSMLTYEVTYSKTKGTTDDQVECRVHAERIGHRGYGMMLGEVGLPPGAEVDRESLEHGVEASQSVYRYEVQPDRVILYFWPEAGGSDFTFAFRPRFEMRAETAPSLLYDYYNPDASVMLKPERFEVGAGSESIH